MVNVWDYADYGLPVAAAFLAVAAVYIWRSGPSKPLPPPGTTVFTPEELAKYNGVDKTQPVYIAIKKTVFDVSARRGMYEPGASYHALAGRDASRALGVNSLDENDCTPVIDDLTPAQMSKLDGWHAYYLRKYPVMGTVDLSAGAASPLPFSGVKKAKEELLDDVLAALNIGDKLFTVDELKQYDGSDSSKPIYVAMKGIVFDVSKSSETYLPGKSYSVFAGKDASKALGMSSLKTEDCSHDYSTLTPKQLETLNGWVKFYAKKYPAVGRVSF